MKYLFYLLFCLLVFSISSCQEYSPKPSGYFRVDLPEQTYSYTHQFEAFEFKYSDQAVIKEKPIPEKQEGEFFNIVYPELNAEIFCSFLLTKKDNIPQLSEESRKFVYLHALKAEAINEKVYENSEHEVYGLVYNIKGNVASPTQFTLTDSINSFFRGALYFNNIPNQDSIAPVLEYINKDIQVLIESFQWK
ncbi:MAG: gliding motility lipoprotein GldD [Bacteroidales bacterium]|nr:gliding motility lipoprotein GldD [Bacteroidales bacterium]